MAFVNEGSGSCRYTVDHDRKITMKRSGGVGMGVECFELDWDGEVIEVEAYGKETNEGKKILAVDWMVHVFRIPDSLEDKRTEVMKIIEEALLARGYSFEDGWNGPVTVDWNPRIVR